MNAMKSNKIRLLPLIFIMAVNPLVVRYYGYTSMLGGLSWYTANDESNDFFNYYKSWFFVAAAAIMLILYLMEFLNKKKENRPAMIMAFIPLGLYGLLALISTVCSRYRYFGLHGIDSQFESLFVLLGYCIAVAYAFHFVRTKNDVQFIMKWFLVGIGIMCLIGITQFVGHDFFATDFGKKMVLPAEKWNSLDLLTFKVDAGRVYMTLFNPNYVGTYAVLTIPVLTVLSLFSKNKIHKIVFGLGSVGVLVCLLGSQSKNGLIALAVALIVMAAAFRKTILKKWKGFLAVAVVFAIAFVGFNMANHNVLLTKIVNGLTIQKDRTIYPLENIEAKEDCVAISYNGSRLDIKAFFDEDGRGTFEFTDENGKILESQIQEDAYHMKVLDERFAGFSIAVGRIDKYNGFVVNIDGVNWPFSNMTGYQGYYYYSPNGKFTKIEQAEDTPFLRGYESVFSGRGYIWSRTLPLMGRHLLLGSGADTFTLVYPQRDYVMAQRHGYHGIAVSKPHNMYMQIGVQTGMLSLLALLVVFGMYLVSCVRIYWNNKFEDYIPQVGAGICAAVVGYLISGIINDSSVTTAPVFWCLLGIGFAVNRIAAGMQKKR